MCASKPSSAVKRCAASATAIEKSAAPTLKFGAMSTAPRAVLTASTTLASPLSQPVTPMTTGIPAAMHMAAFVGTASATLTSMATSARAACTSAVVAGVARPNVATTAASRWGASAMISRPSRPAPKSTSRSVMESHPRKVRHGAHAWHQARRRRRAGS